METNCACSSHLCNLRKLKQKKTMHFRSRKRLHFRSKKRLHISEAEKGCAFQKQKKTAFQKQKMTAFQNAQLPEVYCDRQMLALLSWGIWGWGLLYRYTVYSKRHMKSTHMRTFIHMHTCTCIPAHKRAHSHTHHQHQHLLLLLLVTDCWLLLKVILEIVVLLWCSFTSLITFLSPQYKTIILSLQPLVSCICPSIITR